MEEDTPRGFFSFLFFPSFHYTYPLNIVDRSRETLKPTEAQGRCRFNRAEPFTKRLQWQQTAGDPRSNKKRTSSSMRTKKKGEKKGTHQVSIHSSLHLLLSCCCCYPIWSSNRRTKKIRSAWQIERIIVRLEVYTYNSFYECSSFGADGSSYAPRWTGGSSKKARQSTLDHRARRVFSS